jgi:hypothetical protein
LFSTCGSRRSERTKAAGGGHWSDLPPPVSSRRRVQVGRSRVLAPRVQIQRQNDLPGDGLAIGRRLRAGARSSRLQSRRPRESRSTSADQALAIEVRGLQFVAPGAHLLVWTRKAPSETYREIWGWHRLRSVSVSGKCLMNPLKGPESRAICGDSEWTRVRSRLGGGGASLQRTRLPIEFPDKQGINREFCQDSALSVYSARSNPLQLLSYFAEFPTQQNRELYRRNREFFRRIREFWRLIRLVPCSC